MAHTILIKTDKTESRKKRIYIISGIFGFIFISIGIIAYFYYWSPTLRIRDFSVRGVSNIEEVRQIIVNHMSLQHGMFSPASDRVVFWKQFDGEITAPQFLPLASSIRLASNLTERTVVAEITPRIMKGVWCILDGCFVFDESGILFANAPDVAGSLILKIRDENNTPVTLGSSVLTPDEFVSMERAVEVVQASGIPVSEVVIQNQELKEWATVAPNGFSVRFSFRSIPEDLESVFKGIFERANINTLTYIDLRVPNRVYFK